MQNNRARRRSPAGMLASASMVLILFCANPLLAEPPHATATLTPLDEPTELGFAPARLTLTDAPPETTAVELRWRQGGPTIVHRLAVAPGQPAVARVTLPAVVSVQVYDIRLLPDGPSLDAEILWEPDQVTGYDLVNSAVCADWQYDWPQWPRAGRNLLMVDAVVLAVGLVVLAAGLNLRRSSRRRRRGLALTGGLLVAGIGLIAGAMHLTTGPLAGPVRPIRDDDLMVLRTRRTQHDVCLDAIWRPVYPTRQALFDDTLRITPDEVVLPVLKPIDIRVFRRPRTNAE